MATKIFVTPYIKGPAPAPLCNFSLTRDDCRLFARLAFLRLSPRMQWQYCRPMFFLQMATLTCCAATAIPFAATAGSVATTLLMVIVAALLTALLISATALARSDFRRHHYIAHVARFECPLAFRLTNEDYRTLRQSRSAGQNDQSGDWGFQRLEAVIPERLQAGDVILVEEGQYIYADGVILRGVATVDESAVTGRSMCVLREAGGVSEVMHDTLVVAGRILVEVRPRLGHPLDWIPQPTETQGITSHGGKYQLSS